MLCTYCHTLTTSGIDKVVKVVDGEPIGTQFFNLICIRVTTIHCRFICQKHLRSGRIVIIELSDLDGLNVYYTIFHVIILHRQIWIVGLDTHWFRCIGYWSNILWLIEFFKFCKGLVNSQWSYREPRLAILLVDKPLKYGYFGKTMKA